MKTVLITGANQGIGFETARQLAELNFFVYLGSRNKEHGREAAKKLNDLGLTNVESIVIDVSDVNAVHRAKLEMEAKIEALDILINNAGIAGSEPQDFATCDLKNLRNIFDTNFFGAIQTTQEFLPLLRKSSAGKIINVSSEVGSLSGLALSEGNAGRHKFHAYGASKTALNAFTVMLAYELRDRGISVNSVTPGHTATNLNQFQGIKTVEQGAMAIVNLAAKSHEGTTAKFFNDGGEVAW
jgi:NAD(P)-dependent dehydrogenase (short-subunit alcohol dehydrogenase family)